MVAFVAVGLLVLYVASGGLSGGSPDEVHFAAPTFEGATVCFKVTLGCFTVTANVLRVIDGDTFVAQMKIWPGLTTTEHIRVLGVDAPELTGAKAKAGAAAKLFTVQWIGALPVHLQTCQRDSFGRLLAEVWRGAAPHESLAEELIRSGHGVRR